MGDVQRLSPFRKRSRPQFYKPCKRDVSPKWIDGRPARVKGRNHLCRGLRLYVLLLVVLCPAENLPPSSHHLSTTMSRHEIISPAEVSRKVADGEPVVIYDGYVLDLGEWINMHPGGRIAILHMVGRDATDEINMLVILNASKLTSIRYLWSSRPRECWPDRCTCG
jgi:hypothetical protein